MQRQQTAPYIVTDRLPTSVSVVTVPVERQTWAVVSEQAVADHTRHPEIMRALSEAGFDRQTIREVLDGVRS
ncbi:hypothetical protein [Streptomyces xiamenensis]|uniref:hypothetical protein n=1 Tax=Streptomyces xiamenensis TaxID=408015 RepID=UPI0037D733C5